MNENLIKQECYKDFFRGVKCSTPKRIGITHFKQLVINKIFIHSIISSLKTFPSSRDEKGEKEKKINQHIKQGTTHI